MTLGQRIAARCHNGDCSHPGTPYVYGWPRQSTVLCDQCAIALTNIGMDLRPAPRDERPAWRRRDLSRIFDETRR
jgi:hypothetical protein